MSRQTIMAAGSMLRLLPQLLYQYLGSDRSGYELEFGSSGALRSRIESGYPCQLFISASSIHTQSLVENHYLKSCALLGLNRIVLVHPLRLRITQESALSFLMNPQYQLAMSTTGLDPATNELKVLEKITQSGTLKSGELKKRTRLITGGRETPNAPTGRNQYGWIMETQSVDLLLTYQTHAVEAVADNPNLSFIQLPDWVRVDGHYGIALSSLASPRLAGFYDWLLGAEGQLCLSEYGFEGVIHSH
jgi:ABC-type molybdate transport system substrate-binding protein